MNKKMNDEKPLDLEELSSQELDRSPICEDSVADFKFELPGPHFQVRCNTAKRELLQDCFPEE
jgi:hypothetical protein